MTPSQPIWVSSVQHLQEFADILDHWPRRRRWLGFSAPMPRDFPQVHTFGLLRWMRAPLIFFANGILHIDDRRLQFASKDPPRRFGLIKWFNLQSDLAFELPLPRVMTVERYEQPRAEFSYYIFDWARLKTNDSALMGGDFLVAVGNWGMTMGKVRRMTEDLYEAIRASTVSTQGPETA